MGKTVIDWTPNRVNILCLRWSERVGADAIAAEIGYPGMGPAVLAKAMRAKLPSRIAQGTRRPQFKKPYLPEVPFLRRTFDWEKDHPNYGQCNSLQYTQTGAGSTEDRRPDFGDDADDNDGTDADNNA